MDIVELLNICIIPFHLNMQPDIGHPVNKQPTTRHPRNDFHLVISSLVLLAPHFLEAVLGSVRYTASQTTQTSIMWRHSCTSCWIETLHNLVTKYLHW